MHPTPLTGEQVYQQYCAACHGNGTYSRWDKKFNRFVRPFAESLSTSTASREYLQANIEQGRPGTQMPGWGPHAGGLLPEEITAVIEYLRSSATAVPAMTALTLRGDASNGLSPS